MKKLICFDLDGTLTQHRTPLGEKNRSVLDRLNKRYKLLMVGAGQVMRIFNQLGKYPIDIISATIDGVDCTIEEGKITGMKIEKGKTYKISYSVDSTEMFASEVILNAYR